MTAMPHSVLPFREFQNDAARERAAKIAWQYKRPRQTEFVVNMLARHPWAADYLEQAPVLALAVAEVAKRPHIWMTETWRQRAYTPETAPLFGNKAEFALAEWRKACELGWKLPKLMRHYRIAPPFRALKPGACLSLAWWPIILMGRHLTDAQIAGAMPAKVTHQRNWLRAQVAWYRRMLDRLPSASRTLGLDNPLAHTRWAAVAFGRGVGPSSLLAFRSAADIADYAIAQGSAFNTSWTLTQAADGCARWHQELATASSADLEQRFCNDEAVDYAPFSDEFVASTGHKVVALRTGRSLYDEGAAMRHCVLEYRAEVLFGTSRIFSVRRPDGFAICTFELRREPIWKAGDIASTKLGAWRMAQAQGRRDSYLAPRPPMPPEALSAIGEFLAKHCQDALAPDANDPAILNCRSTLGPIEPDGEDR